MIVVWGIIALVLIIAIAIVAVLAYCGVSCGSERRTILCFIGSIATIVLAVAICFGLHWYFYDTQSGQRTIKDWQIDVEGGIERTVTVYDIEGDIIAEYNGKFDVESDDEKIKFDDEDGKRHIIYFTTGTITIDEN